MNTANNAAPQITALNFDYIESSKTDVMKTFERFGYQRPDVKRQEAMRLLLNGFNVANLDEGVVAAQAALV
jgi:hypothetical protein